MVAAGAGHRSRFVSRARDVRRDREPHPHAGGGERARWNERARGAARGDPETGWSGADAAGVSRARHAAVVENLLQDLRYALRQLRKAPGFTFTAVLTLALGIGGMTAVFSVVQAVLLRPLPFKDSGQLISLHERVEEDPHDFNVTAPDILIFQRESKTFSGEGGYIGTDDDLTGAGAPFHAAAERVTASLFPTLGVDPLLGRTFTQEEDENGAPLAVISYSLWRERFQRDPGVLGRKIDLDRRPYTIIGVMPQNFEFPLDAGRLSHRDLWVPMSFTTVEKSSEGENYDYGLLARLRPGVSTAQAQIDVDRVIAGIQPSYTKVSTGLHLHGYFRSLKEETVRKGRSLLNMLLASGRLDFTDRLCEPRKSVAGARSGTKARIRSPPGVGRCSTRRAQTVDDREPPVKRNWGCSRHWGGCNPDTCCCSQPAGFVATTK